MLFEGGIHMKKRQWMVQRHTIECADAPYRWDRSYHYLVQWSAMGLKEFPAGPFPQESRDESCHVCAGLDPTAGADANDRAATRPLTGTQPKTGMCLVRWTHFSRRWRQPWPNCVVLVS